MAQTVRDKTPPHDDELEQAALGSLLTDYEAVTTAIEMHLHSGDFYSRANTRVYEAILSLDEKRVRPDIQSVVQELKQMGKLDEAGGASYVSSLTSIIPSSANIEYYAQMVKNYSLKRSLLKLASSISINAYDESKEAGTVLEDMQKDFNKLLDERQIVSARKVGDILKDTIDIIQQVMKNKNATTGIPSGFKDLDSLTAGFQRDEFIIIGARPSVGKTALALNIASNIAIHSKIPTAFFSLEMSSHALLSRIISSEANVRAHNIRTGFLSTSDFDGIIDASAIIYESPLYIIDMPNGKISDIRTQARRMKSQQDVKIVFIDYLGLIASEPGNKQRFEQISDISRSLKSLARELEIPIVVLCQLNRDAQFETPTLANLRDSGSIEQDADLVLFLHRPQPKDKKKKDDEAPAAPLDNIPTDLIIAKQRNGPTGVVKLQLVTKYAKFAPLEKERVSGNVE
ncbi:MAG: replicative DNA helicase [Treponema sp.]|nr:replicative DNA helicase [Treponema sp.]